MAKVFTHLARTDLTGAVLLAKNFTGDAPRSYALLAIARSVLDDYAASRTPKGEK